VIGLLLILAGDGVAENVMSLDGAVVYRPARADARDAFEKLVEADAVVSAPPREAEKLAGIFAAAVAKKPKVFHVARPVVVLSTGPLLDGPDKVKPTRLVRDGKSLRLDIVHTRVREQGIQLRRNIQWRPMVSVPLDLPCGAYTLHVTWRAVESMSDPKPLKSAPATRTVAFEVRGASSAAP